VIIWNILAPVDNFFHAISCGKTRWFLFLHTMRKILLDFKTVMNYYPSINDVSRLSMADKCDTKYI